MLTTFSKEMVALKAKLFRGFADSSRLSILELLRDGEKTVSELVSATGLSQSNVSNHLACLRACGLVSARPEGRFTLSSLADDTVRELLAQAERLLLATGCGVETCSNYIPEEVPASIEQGGQQ